MKHLKVLIALLFAVATALVLLDPTASSQGQDPNAQTNQADKVSGTGVTATAIDDPKFGPRCLPVNDCEGSNPFDSSTFTFSAADGERPPAADRCPLPCPDCPEPEECGDDRRAAEAPADFSTDSNGFASDKDHEADLEAFDKFDLIDEGLGPVYNAQACRECHQNPVSGAISQITELRAGHNVGNEFFDAPGGSLINDRAINSKVQERVPPLFSALVYTRLIRRDDGGGVGEIPAYPTPSPTPAASPIPSPSPIPNEEPVRTFRTSLNLLGDGFVEVIPNGTLLAISNAQAAISGGVIRGLAIAVPVLEANIRRNPDCAISNSDVDCLRRIGRFGWKDQIPSLLSFSGDAYLNEMGITNFLVRAENTSLGRPVSAFDDVSDEQKCEVPVEFCEECLCGEDTERDIDAFTRFMRATKAPPQDHDVQAEFADDIREGRQLFTQMPGLAYSCSACHVPAIVTARPGVVVNQGFLKVDKNLGFKIIRPFGDFLLHDIGTGDGIVQNGGQPTRLKVRTPPLWGVRTRTRLMHDGSSVSPTGSAIPPPSASFTFMEAILRHQGEAAAVTAHFQLLTNDQKRRLIMFLESL
jgi:CxxC motif-containing protein (DUF1111 family)